MRAVLDGIFNDKVFVISFLSNVVVAALIVFLGDQLGVGAQLSTGVVVVLGRPHLLQRRLDPPTPLPRMSSHPDPTPPRRRTPTRPGTGAARGQRADGRGGTGCG